MASRPSLAGVYDAVPLSSRRRGPRETQAIESSALRGVLSRFCTGLTVITARGSAGPVGFTCQAFVSISLDPPIVGFFVSPTSQTCTHIQESRRFCVNVLGAQQVRVCETFASMRTDKFVGVGWHPTSTGNPILDGAIVVIDCKARMTQEIGDHILVTGDILSLHEENDDSPLGFYQSQYATVTTVTAD